MKPGRTIAIIALVLIGIACLQPLQLLGVVSLACAATLALTKED